MKITRFLQTLLFASLLSSSALAQTFKILHTFGDDVDNAGPPSGMLLSGTNFYGISAEGGHIFSIGTNGEGYTNVYTFTNGSAASADYQICPLVILSNTLYGVQDGTPIPGLNGTLFAVNSDGAGYTILHSFAFDDIGGPEANIVLAGNTLYGTTGGSDQYPVPNGGGAVFSINLDGTGFDILKVFDQVDRGINVGGTASAHVNEESSNTLFGSVFLSPNNLADFAMNTDGTGFTTLPVSNVDYDDTDFILSGNTLYGISTHGTNGDVLTNGAIIAINTDGTDYRTLHIFSDYKVSSQHLAINSDGSLLTTLILSNGMLYGATAQGGIYGGGVVFALNTNGTGFTVLQDFDYSKNGGWPNSLVLSGNTLYGTAVVGTNVGTGMIFSLTLNGSLKVTLSPPTAVQAGAEWQVDSGSFFKSGDVITNLSAGSHIVSFKSVKGWAAPADQAVFVTFAETNTVTGTYMTVGTTQLVVSTNGSGTIKPDLNGESLEIGKTYIMTAKAGKGFGFVNWTGSTMTNSPRLKFVMASNLMFTANFRDITRPVIAILSPKNNQIVTNAVVVATGKAKDNVGVTAVSFRVNNGAWLAADLTDGTNWLTPNLSSYLVSGANTLSAFALDAAGNASLTNTVRFQYVVP